MAGGVKSIIGEYKLTPIDADNTKVNYTLDVDAGFGVPGPVRRALVLTLTPNPNTNPNPNPDPASTLTLALSHQLFPPGAPRGHSNPTLTLTQTLTPSYTHSPAQVRRAVTKLVVDA